ncbi:MAG: fimbrillin family protein [Alistipes senegalensis]|nr:fimbrillin family protein [Bacteroides cellulosilyticus]MCM1351937.1 fimbrillin family protein [Alistipes senegalensis]
MRKFSIIAIALWAIAACSKEDVAPTGSTPEIRIAGEMETGNPESQPEAQSLTRASETAFEEGDQIGLRVEQNSVAGHRNACLTHNGKVFKGKRVNWDETAGDAVVSACYPFVKGDDIPAEYSVPQNQQTDEQYAAADFLAASRPVTVAEFAEPVKLQFRHVLSKVIFNLADETGKNLVIDRVAIKGFKHVALIDYAQREAAVNAAAMPANISGHKVENLKHEAILVPQTDEAMMIEVYAKADGITLLYQKRAKNVELKSGYRYKVKITLKPGEETEIQEIEFKAEIEPWGEGEDVPETQI